MIAQRLARMALRIIARVARGRPADVVIGTPDNPYLLRWWVIPRNHVFNVYLHRFCRSDDDRALHDHPWWWASWLLVGEYTEHTIRAGGVHDRRIFRVGSFRVNGAKHAHRIELHAGPVWTLFVTGPKFRTWGFHCPAGWVNWHAFTDPASHGRITGKGCDQ